MPEPLKPGDTVYVKQLEPMTIDRIDNGVALVRWTEGRNTHTAQISVALLEADSGPIKEHTQGVPVL